MVDTIKSPTYNGAVPADGPLCVFMNVPLYAGSVNKIDLRDLYSRGFISGIQAIYVDAHDLKDDVTFYISDTQQRIIITAGTQGYYPVLSTTQYTFDVYCAINATVKVHFLNFAIASGQWGASKDFPTFAAGANVQFEADGSRTLINAVLPELIEGENITISKDTDGITISADVPQLIAGDNITISEGDDGITISASGSGSGSTGGSTSSNGYGGTAFQPVPTFYYNYSGNVRVSGRQTILLPLGGSAMQWKSLYNGGEDASKYVANGGSTDITFKGAKLVTKTGTVTKKFRVRSFLTMGTQPNLTVIMSGTLSTPDGSITSPQTALAADVALETHFAQVPVIFQSGSDVDSAFYIGVQNASNTQVNLQYDLTVIVEYLGEG